MGKICTYMEQDHHCGSRNNIYKLLFNGGKMKDNNTALFFTGIEIQYETEEQKEIIIQVLRDMLTLGEEELKNKNIPIISEREK